MKISVPEKLYRLAKRLPAPLYVVGGVCRDSIAGLSAPQPDWDICSPLSPEVVVAAAKDVGIRVDAVYKNTGTVKMTADVPLEYTCFRTDKYVRGMHSPTEVCFTTDINLDARRRDFKCNAIYYDILADEYCDPLGGIEDIKKGIISTVAPAKKVFGEDGLRLMRLARIAAQTGFGPTDECLNGAISNANLICDVAPERIWAELCAILCADKKYSVKNAHYNGLKLLHKSGVLKIILPELAAGDGLTQRSDYHDHDVLEHSFRAALYAPEQIRFAALLHDVGKPYCVKEYGKSFLHAQEGKRITLEICNRLKVPKKLSEQVSVLTELHMYDLNCAAAENKVRKFIVNNYAVMDELLLLKQADYSACKDDLDVAPCVKKWKKIIADMQSEGTPFNIKGLNIRGNELIEAGISPNQTAKALNFLLAQVAMKCVENQKDRLIAFALAAYRVGI